MQLEREIGKPVCIEGCGKCCERVVPLASGLEVSYITGHLPSLDNSDRVTKRALEWLEDDNPELIRTKELRLGSHEKLQEQVSLLRVGRCPFLLETAECLIYQVRPMACRAYGVTSPSNTWCNRPLAGMESDTFCWTIDRKTPVGEQIQAYVIALWQAIDHFNMEHLKLYGLLPTMVAELLDPVGLGNLHRRGTIQPAKLAKGQGERWELFNMDSPLRAQ